MTEPNQPEQPQNPTPAPPAAAPPPPEATGLRRDDRPPPGSIAEKPKPQAVIDERMDRLRRKQVKSGKVPSLSEDAGVMPGLPTPRNADEELERQLQEAMGGLSEKDMYGTAQPPRPKPAAGAAPPPTGRRKGRVLSVHGPDVFVELPGSRSQGLLPVSQFPEGRPAPGTEVEVEIETYDPANGLLVLTRKGAALSADWSTVAAGMIVEARVTEVNKGGLTVSVNGIRGFLPISQIDLFRVENAEQYVNQRLICEVVEVDPESRNLVVSRRNLLEREREEQREKAWAEVQEGQIREGVVRKVENFGAFVDIGNVDGLLHVSEMSWARVRDPRELLQPGLRLKVIVLKVDREKRRIGLGLKQLAASPWDTLEERFPVGSIVTGKVTRLAEFGAFVELEPGVEGLAHVSELAAHRVNRPGEVVQPEQEVRVKVLSIDKEKRRLSLSIKEAQKAEAQEAEPEPTPEQQAAAPPEPPKPRQRPENLRGGIGGQSGGGIIPLR